MPNKVLVTGASGLLGVAAIETFLSAGWDVVGVSRRKPELPSGRLLGGVGSQDGARPAESFGYDRRQGQSAIETLAVELTEPLARLLPVPNDHDRLNGIVAPCTSPAE